MHATLTARAPPRAAPALACRFSVAKAAPLCKAALPRARRAALARRGAVCYTVRALARTSRAKPVRAALALAHAAFLAPSSHRITLARSLTQPPLRALSHFASQEWLLDAPGCAPYREVEEVAEAGAPTSSTATAAAAGTRVDRRVTHKPLHVADDCAAGVVHGIPADLKRLEKAVPLNLSEVRTCTMEPWMMLACVRVRKVMRMR